ncbi:hypothetical protein BGZ70_002241 [Mortierella alpina]|uniref:Sodium/calcium exchanger membrane region domain-containing protein n=1 Tax=Mortierella alpina TaxID=64518 RepID=A0A9P6IUE9_MORAP|nr:hypothetical protein BGZ70_002241 [Mortierella alpina]
MSNLSSGSVRFQIDPPPSRTPARISSSAPTTSYITPPDQAQSSSLLSPHGYTSNNVSSSHGPSTSNYLTPAAAESHSAAPPARPARRGSRRNRNNNHDADNNNQSSLSYSSSTGSVTGGQLRPRRSIVTKSRLRHLQFNDDDRQQQQQQYPVPASPSSPSASEGHSGVGVGDANLNRRATSTLRKTRLSFRTHKPEEDTSGLLGPSYEPNRENIEMDALSHQHHKDVPLSSIDLSDEHSPEKMHGRPYHGHGDEREEGDHHHSHRTLDQFIHGNRPDRNLFPYRNTKDNLHAMRTFFRRFFLVLLIIPGWVIPYVITARMKHDKELKDQSHLKARGGGEDMMMSKTVNVSVFILNMFAMMHLGKAAGACLEELVPKLGMRVVSIFDAMTSSSVELAVAAFALMKGLVRVVQAAMLGAILNNLLLMMGITFVVGGYYHQQQPIQADTSQTGMNLLMIVCISYVIPVALDATFTEFQEALIPANLTPTKLLEAKAAARAFVDHDILTISKVMAMIMLVLYGCCLLFQYSSEHFMVTPEAKHAEEHTLHRRNTHYWFAGFAYCVMLGAQIYSANLLVHAVEALGKQYHLNDSFVGFVLLPIVLISDLQEEVIAIKESKANRLDRSVALMIGSCMQISLLVTPLLILLGWIIDEPMTFRFSLMEAVILAGSVLMVNYLIQDNETNWLEGGLLLAAFFMCAMAFYYDVSSFHAPSVGGDHGGAGGGEAPAGGGGGGHH